MRIGLFGGTFDPPHKAHLGACLLAMHHLNLDRVWWLVTPGNPLKAGTALAPLAERVAAARALARHPRIDVTGFEAAIGVRYTYDLVRYLVARAPRVHFVWIMGADNLRSFHRWNNWRGIAKLVPFAIVDRLGPSLYASASIAGQALDYARLPEQDAIVLPTRRPPAWVYLHGLKSPLSSTALRAMRRSHGHHQSPAYSESAEESCVRRKADGPGTTAGASAGNGADTATAGPVDNGSGQSQSCGCGSAGERSNHRNLPR